MEDFLKDEEEVEAAVKCNQLTLKQNNVQQQQLIYFDRKNAKTKKSKIKMFLKGNFLLRGSLAVKNMMVQQSRYSLSTTAIRKVDQQVEPKDDLVVDYLDGDQTGIVVFGLNRPQAKNSFSRNLVYQLIDAVEAVKFDKGARVVIIKSTTPGIFCAGADLKERAKMPAHLVGAFVGKARRLITDLENLPMPVIAAIDGHALGKNHILILSTIKCLWFIYFALTLKQKVVGLRWPLPVTYALHPILPRWDWWKPSWQLFLVQEELKDYLGLLDLHLPRN